MPPRGASIGGDAPADRPDEGGSTPTAPLFRRHDWRVYETDLDTARVLVFRYHYARGGSNTATYLHGLFRRQVSKPLRCYGVAWWIPPTKTAAQSAYPQNWNGVLALSRLVIRPEVPTNACSFLIRHSMRQIDRERWPCLLSYADDWRGHVGKIYKAAGWREDGKTKPERTYLLDGRMISRKAGPKTRTHAEMLALGCEYVGSFAKTRFVHVVGG